MFENKICQIKIILDQYDKIKLTSNKLEISNDIKQEQFIIKKMLDDLLWNNLEDNVKQEKRRAMLMLMDKWSYEEGSVSNVTYEKGVVDLYSRIEEVLSVLNENTEFVVRLKSILLVEKLFINEQKEFNKMRHMDYYVWSNLFEKNQQEEIYQALDLDSLHSTFKTMYCSWPKRPYKDIN